MTLATRNLGRIALLSLGTFACVHLSESRAGEKEEGFWSFQPVRPVISPAVGDQTRVASPIDEFILAELEKRKLSPSTLADRRTLIRRATYDLAGLPPTIEEIDAFLADESIDAFAKVIDRLLGSPHYGERWGRHWLDVVRYADARDLIQLPPESDFREAWRYRDWVVSALNRDLPYDQFVTLQVAGDLLQPTDTTRIDADALVATGMLAIADFVPGDVDKQQMIADYVNDQIDVVGRTFMGLTLACARCHDHKFDPVSIDDYYSLAGIFFSTRLIPGPVKGNTPLVRVPLLAPAAIATIEANQARDKARLIELSHSVKVLGEREYQSYLEKRVEADTALYLLSAWECVHSAVASEQNTVADFARGRGLDKTVLARWIIYFDEQQPHPALQAIRAALDAAVAAEQTRELAKKLAVLAEKRRANLARDRQARTLSESILLHFRADDRRVATDDAQGVSAWPNHGRGPHHASPVPDTPAPVTTFTHERRSPVLRFSGAEMLEAPVSVPATGSLFVVFRPNPAGTSGQRLVGWEDAALGQHGLGIMTDGAGSVHAILRRNGANGDVVLPASSGTQSFQVLSISWGTDGVAVHRNGQPAGINKGIDSVSSDPAITALRIGGAGSGSSQRFQGDIAELRVYDLTLDEQARSHVEVELMNRWCSTTEAAANWDVVADLYEEFVSAQSPFRLEVPERDHALPDEFRQRSALARDELATLDKKAPPDIPRAVVVQEGGPPGTPHEGFHDAQVYLRGDHLKPGHTVPRGFPKVIAGVAPVTIREGSGRRELAHWLTRPEHPLTARVMVNRIWQHHFGLGLVASSGNFGLMGESPTHPELLDSLAARFVSSGWSVKAMHRLIMLSNVYQQSVVSSPRNQLIDPENRWLWRANRRRLEAELIRDSVLAAAGRLDSTPGGPAFQDISIPRRSLYVMTVRTGTKSGEFGALFDSPDCSRIVERRQESIVAPQALFLMNDPLVTDLAKNLAERVLREVPDRSPHERIQRLYEIVLGRPPVESEIEIGLPFLTDVTQPGLWAGYCRLILCANEFLFVD
jgi:hypothetical protein